MRRDHWKVRNDRLDPETDFVEIYRNLTMYEFPWDMNQALSFALFRTYAVPSIGRLLDETGAFTGDVQKRYDDTALLLEPPTLHGFEHPDARTAIRRINQMHRSYDIPNHEMRYVLSTFVVVPQRWVEQYGKRQLSPNEVAASVHYYRALGAHMGIREIPETFAGFGELMDSYEREHFAFDEGGRRVADATLRLMLTFHPRFAAPVVEVASRAFMDDALRQALRYDSPSPVVIRASRAALRARGRLLRLFPARRHGQRAADLSWVRSYPDGYDLAQLGTFPAGCPVRPADGEPRPGRGA